MSARTDDTVETLGAFLSLRRAQCTPMRYPRSGCRSCLDACTLDALRRDGAAWSLAPACDSCGACVAACPTGALDVHTPSTAHLEAAIRDDLGAPTSGDILFACERCPERSGLRRAIRIPCAARLDEATLVGAVLQGARRVAILFGDCGSCERRGRIRKVLGGVLRAARSVLEACGEDAERLWVGRVERFSSRPDEDATRPAPGRFARRDFFRRLVREAVAERTSEPAAATCDGRRSRLLAAVRSRRDAIACARPASLPLASITVDSECLGCTVCEHVCATGAITREESAAGTVTLRFDAGLCVACAACADACMPAAITLRTASNLDALAPHAPELLASVTFRRCRACRESFYSEAHDLCPRCRCFGGNGAPAPGLT